MTLFKQMSYDLNWPTPAGSTIGGRQETGKRGRQGNFSQPQVAKHMFSAFKSSNTGKVGVTSGHLHAETVVTTVLELRKGPGALTTIDIHVSIPGNKYGAVRPIMITKKHQHNKCKDVEQDV